MRDSAAHLGRLGAADTFDWRNLTNDRVMVDTGHLWLQHGAEPFRIRFLDLTDHSGGRSSHNQEAVRNVDLI